MSLKLTSYPKSLPQSIGSHHTEFKALAENSPDIICRFGKEYHHLYVNPAIEQITGIPQGIFIGKTPYEIGMPKPFADFWTSNIGLVFKTSKQVTVEFSFPTKDGEKHFQALLVPEFNQMGEITTVLSMSRDITLIKEHEKQKNDFIGMVSHELKTPLASLKAYTQVLEKRFRRERDEANSTHLEKMDSQLNKLANIINDLLDITKIQSGKLQFRERLFDFNEFVEETVENVQRTTDTHKINITGSVRKKMYGDRDRLGQVLINLLSNAVKYSPDGKNIDIFLTSDSTTLTCSVRDYGVGISKAVQKKIFERFFQVSSAKLQTFSGLGLGLYISSEIIKRQRGKIWVVSEKGKGSTFYFSLPLRKKSN